MIFWGILAAIEHIAIQLVISEMQSNVKGLYWVCKKKNAKGKAAGMIFHSTFEYSYAETNLLFGTKNLEEVIQSAGNELTVTEFYKMPGYFIEKEMPDRRRKNSIKAGG